MQKQIHLMPVIVLKQLKQILIYSQLTKQYPICRLLFPFICDAGKLSGRPQCSTPLSGSNFVAGQAQVEKRYPWCCYRKGCLRSNKQASYQSYREETCRGCIQEMSTTPPMADTRVCSRLGVRVCDGTSARTGRDRACTR